MSPVKRLIGQTAVYGLSSIVGRLLNYLLVPLYTRLFVPEVYGVVTELYAYVVFLLVVLTYGMETAFFRFAESEKNWKTVYSTSLISLFSTSFIFILLSFIFSTQIANILQYSNHAEYIVWFALIVGIDAFTAVPFAKLRQQNKPLRFATLKLINIASNIGLNLFFLLLCPFILKHNSQSIIGLVYSPKIGVGYVFISNLLSSILILILFIPEYISVFKVKTEKYFDFVMYKKMLKYALPLMLVGLAGTVNEVIDRILLKHLLPSDVNVMEQIGIYGANLKLAVLMTLFIQTFRYAAEPFFFSQAKEKNSKELFADVTKYFIIFCLLIFLGVVLYMDILKYFIAPDYFSGLKIVPILLISYLFLGVIYNLSFWYKLSNRTQYGAYISVIGAFVTLIANYILIPFYGYVGAAIASFLAHFLMMALSYYWGQKFYFIKYNLQRIGFYFVFALLIYAVSTYIPFHSIVYTLLINSILFFTFVFTIYKTENLKRLFIRK